MPEPSTYTFGEALDKVVNCHAIRRLSWPDDGTYVVLNDGILKIFIPFTKEMHPLLVSFVDMTGEDWVTVAT